MAHVAARLGRLEDAEVPGIPREDGFGRGRFSFVAANCETPGRCFLEFPAPARETSGNSQNFVQPDNGFLRLFPDAKSPGEQ